MLFLYHLSLECTCDWLSLKKDKKVETEIQIYTSTAKRLQACQDYHSKSLFQNAQWWPTWVMMSLSILFVISGVHQVVGGWNYLWKWFWDGIFNPKRMETSGWTRPWAERLHAHHTTPSHQRPIHSTLVATLHLINAQCSLRKSWTKSKPESTVMCQYECQRILFVQPIRNLIWLVS